MEEIWNSIKFDQTDLKTTQNVVNWRYVGNNFLIVKSQAKFQLIEKPIDKSLQKKLTTDVVEYNSKLFSARLFAGKNNELYWKIELFRMKNDQEKIYCESRVELLPTLSNDTVEYDYEVTYVKNSKNFLSLVIQRNFERIFKGILTSKFKVAPNDWHQIIFPKQELVGTNYVILVVKIIAKLNPVLNNSVPEEKPIIDLYNLSTSNFSSQATEYYLGKRNHNQIQVPENISGNKKLCNPIPKILEDLTALFDQPFMDDVVLVTKNEQIPTHKIILTARSSVFKEMFNIEGDNSVNEICIKDFTHDTVKEMLRYIYTGQFEEKGEESAKELLKIATKYDISSLLSDCQETLTKYLKKENALELLKLADSCKAETLKSTIIDFMIKNINVFDENDLQTLGVNLVTKILIRVGNKN